MDRFQGIFGLNYTWDEFELPWLEQVTFIVGYAREVILVARPQSGILRPGDVPQLGDLLADNAFRNALAGRILCKFSEETQFQVSEIADFVRRPNYYLQLSLTPNRIYLANLDVTSCYRKRTGILTGLLLPTL